MKKKLFLIILSAVFVLIVGGILAITLTKHNYTLKEAFDKISALDEVNTSLYYEQEIDENGYMGQFYAYKGLFEANCIVERYDTHKNAKKRTKELTDDTIYVCVGKFVIYSNDTESFVKEIKKEIR